VIGPATRYKVGTVCDGNMRLNITRMYCCWAGRKIFPFWNIPKLHSAMLGEILEERADAKTNVALKIRPFTQSELHSIYIVALLHKNPVDKIIHSGIFF